MRIHRQRVYWFCLLAYLWSATGMGNVALIAALVSNHLTAPVVVVTGQDDEVIVHHVGHRDVHEPTAVDTQDNSGRLAGEAHHEHSDHVLKLASDTYGKGPAFKDDTLSSVLSAKLLGVAPRPAVSIASASRDFFPARSAVRNSTVAFVQITRLRI